MVSTRDWVPAGVDTATPNIARIYDYWLGGSHNFETDRNTADHIERTLPWVRQSVRLNRAFLGRAVRFMVARGIRQFLDLGAGIPTVGNVHEIAQREAPEARVVYVDKEAVAVAHSELLLTGDDRTSVLHADVRDVAGVLASAEVRRLIDFSEPVGLLCMLLLHWIPDEDDPAGLVHAYQEPLAPGSLLAFTHVTSDAQPELIAAATGQMAEQRGEVPLDRSHDQVLGLLGDLELVEPGLVGCGSWRPAGPTDIAEDPIWNELLYAGVARKS
ncbi:SAM-dependent methyltransferase [Amycolatopsis thailandensis]|uniref:SAM-dependent methyltransferase n=1 Tax=Amycolatopsis thailandensis TaxID=589330 RepID=UPI0037BA33EB